VPSTLAPGGAGVSGSNALRSTHAGGGAMRKPRAEDAGPSAAPQAANRKDAASPRVQRQTVRPSGTRRMPPVYDGGLSDGAPGAAAA
jgi:hypothetical protein